MAALGAKVHSAQMRALRHQLNPHFLFNTLNSIAALIRGGNNGTAETMIENLSDFMRTGFAMDPYDDIPLSRELDLQRTYLDIERLRFPDRIVVTFDIPERLQQARVPALITQPIVENTIKYAVARSTIPVHIKITARERDGLLVLRIGDDGGDAPASETSGTKVGLSNIESRLRARFGDRYKFRGRPWPTGGFEVELGLPLAVED
jgi:LytS/YehU family sensor histidine kinase